MLQQVRPRLDTANVLARPGGLELRFELPKLSPAGFHCQLVQLMRCCPEDA